jgi:hypothetical protein
MSEFSRAENTAGEQTLPIEELEEMPDGHLTPKAKLQANPIKASAASIL